MILLLFVCFSTNFFISPISKFVLRSSSKLKVGQRKVKIVDSLIIDVMKRRAEIIRRMTTWKDPNDVRSIKAFLSEDQ